MPREKVPIPADLQQLSEEFKLWRSVQPLRSRLPESMWAAALEKVRQHGLHRTAKALRLDYTRLKQRLEAEVPAPRQLSAAFLEMIGSPAHPVAECVVELESARGRMRVAMKGAVLDWAGLLRAWRDAEA